MDLDCVAKNGLEYYLKTLGVAQETINKSKKEFSHFVKERKSYYNPAGEQKDVLIKVNEIKGITRVSNQNWFDIVKYSLNGQHHSKNINIHSGKFYSLFSSLEQIGLENFKQALASQYNSDLSDGMIFELFIKNNKKYYFLYDDGNHRTTILKVIGAEYIRAAKIYIYDFDDKKYQDYLSYKKIKKHFHDSIKNSDFNLTINDDQRQFVVLDYRSFNHRYIKLSTLPPLYNWPRVDIKQLAKWCDIAQNTEKRLKNIEEHSTNYFLKYRFFPRFLLKNMRKNFSKNLQDDKEIGRMIGLKHLLDKKSNKRHAKKKY